MAKITVENLTQIYSPNTPFARTALEGVSFSVDAGEVIGIIGHTGSGKSTLISHLNGLLKPTAGRVLLDGEDIWQNPKEIRRIRFRVGLCFQYSEYQLFEETVARDIAFGPQNQGLSAEESDARVREAMRFVGLPDSLREVSPFDLSGGQKRRVAIAGVMAMRPEVIVFDEPTAGLDPRGAAELLSAIRTYRDETGATVLIVSHSMEEIAECADRILVMNHGTVECFDTPERVFADASRLREIGLALPEVTEVCDALARAGLPVSPSLCTVEDAVAALAALKGGAKE